MKKKLNRRGDSHVAARPALRPLVLAVSVACCGSAYANPTGPQVAAGAARFSAAGKSLSVTNAPGTIINWQSFSIQQGEHTRFLQQSASSAVLNRVVGNDASSILGALSSNGRVFLVNPHGIVFGAGARIDTAGFIASTLNIADRDFLQGRFKFEGGGNGVLRNAGVIRASGDIMLVGPAIENAGIIRSDNGSVILAAGKSVTITSPDAQGVKFALQAPTDSAINLGTIDAGNAAAMFAGTLVHSGDIRATTATMDGGRVVLSAQKDAIVQSGGVISVAGTNGGSVFVQSGDLTMIEGTIDAHGIAGKGGNVQLLGNRVGLSGAQVDASGETGGGAILVGGDYQGANAAVQNAKATYLGPDATLKADALSTGDGGRIVVWGTDTARVYGSISAQGGALSGDGGFVETSGHYLDVTSLPSVAAPAGRGGMWLLDPGQVTIVDGFSSSNITAGPNFEPSPADSNSTVGSSLINSALLTGNVSISTGVGPGGGSGDIIFDAPPTAPIIIDNMEAPFSTLTLNAAADIRFINGPTTFRTSGVGNSSLIVQFNPGQLGTGGVITNVGATTTLQRTSALGNVTAVVLNGKTWQNNGTINIGPSASINLFDGGTAALARFTNAPGGVVNIDVVGGLALASDSGSQAIADNAGMMNLASTATLAVAFGNTGTLNLNAGTLFLTNGKTIAGTVAIAPAATLQLSESRISPTLFDGTNITNSGLIKLQGSPGGPNPPAATFTNVIATSASLEVNANATASFGIGPSTFGNVSVPFVVPVPGMEIPGVLTSSADLTIGNALTLGSSATFNAATQAGSVALSGGVLGGTGALASSTLTWTGGTIAGSGVKTFTDITSSNNVDFTGNMVLTGGTWSNSANLAQNGAGLLTLFNGAVVNNSGNWNLAFTSPDPVPAPIRHGGGTATSFNNSGGFFNSPGTPHALTVSRFLNSGAVLLDDGSTLTLPAGGVVPDTGTITVGNGATITFNGDRTLGGSVIGNGTVGVSGGTTNFDGTLSINALTITGGTANINVPATIPGAFTLSSGTLGGTGLLTLEGPATWSGGTMTGSGTTQANAGLLIIGASHALLDQRILANAAAPTAAITWSRGDIGVGGNATILNQGTWSDQSTNASITNAGGAATFSNAGTYTKSAAGTSNVGITFNHSGAGASVGVQDGTLRLSGGGTSSRPFTVAGTLELASNYAINAGSDISGSGAVDFSAGTTILSGGTYNMAGAATRVSGGTATFDAGVTLADIGAVTLSAGALTLNSGEPIGMTALTLSGGSLGGTDAVTLTGSGTWSGGTLFGNLNVAGAAALNITGSADKTLAGGTITNSALITLDGAGNLLLNAGAVINNNSTGVFDIQSGADLNRNVGADPALNNNGVFRKSGPVDTTVVGTTGRINFVNAPAARIETHSGTLQFASGSFPVNAGIIDLQSGTISTAGAPLENTGVIGGSGTVDLAGAALTNNGRLRPGAAAGSVGTLTITGDLVQGAAGIVNIDLAGNGPGSADLIAVSGSAALAGRLNVTHVDGFFPSSDTSFTLMTFTSSAGDFTTKTFPDGYQSFYSAAPTPGAAPTSYALRLGAVINRWIGTTGAWDNAANWRLGHAPTAGEDAVIPDVGAPGVSDTVTVFNGSRAARRITSEENLNVSGGALTLGAQNSRINAAFDISDGTVTFGGPLVANSVNISGGGVFIDSTLAASSVALSGGFLDVRSGTLPALTMSGGLLTRSTPDVDLTVTGPFIASGGLIMPAGTGRFVTAGPSTVAGITAARDWLNTGVAELNGTLTLSSANFINVSGGVVSIVPGGRMTGGMARLTNDGTINLNTADAEPFGPFVPGPGTQPIINNGVLSKSGPGFVNLMHPFTNSATGVVNVNEGTLSAAFGGSQSGTIEIAPGAILNTDGALTNTASGIIGGRGTLELFGSTLTNDGTLRPGSAGGSTGELTLLGNLTNTGTVAVRLAGQADGQFDRLLVSGTAALGGTLNLATTSGYTATDGDTFTVIGASAITGDFGTLTKTFANGVNVLSRPSFYLIGLGGPTVNSWITDASGLWTEASHWSLGHAPLATEQVFINRPSTLTVTLPGAAFAADSLRSTENIVLAGTLDLTSASSINAMLSITSGELRGAGGVSVTDLSLNGTISSAGGVTVTGSTSISGPSVLNGALTTNGFTMPGGSLSIESASALNFAGIAPKSIAGATLTNRGSVSLAENTELALTAGALWDNFGAVNLGGASRLVLSGDGAATLINRGTGVITDTSTNAAPITLAGAAPGGKAFANAGTLTKAVGSADVQTLDVPMTNTGTINVLAGTINAIALPSNSGVIDLAPEATLSTAGSPLTNNPLSVVKGNGILNLGGSTFTSSGTVAPGASPGTLTISGSYAQTAGGVLAIELGGRVPGADFDVLKVSGSASLGGTLIVTRPPGSTLTEGSAFELMTYASRTGDFAAFSVPSGFAFQTAPGPTAYTLSNTVARPLVTQETFAQVSALAQKDAVVLQERALVTGTRNNTDAQKERQALGECR